MNIKIPTLLVDEQRVKENIERMAAKAKHHSIRFRPHFKTHQSKTIAGWFREAGVSSIAVSSLTMARYFARHGWHDIQLAVVINPREIDDINRLAKRIDLQVLVENAENVHLLEKKLRHPVKTWIKIDTGYHRTGVAGEDIETIIAIARLIKHAKKLSWGGLLTHSGHTYHAKSVQSVHKIHQNTAGTLNKIRERLLFQGITGTEISIGDTPGCSLAENFNSVDEIRPGNFVFYDLKQLFIGSCDEENLALALACPVISLQHRRNELVIYGGAIHLSKDFVEDNQGVKLYGLTAPFSHNRFGRIFKHTYVSSLSQEHGIIRTRHPELFALNPGDLILIFPVHACLAVNLMRKMTTLNGEVIDVMKS